MRSRAKQGTGRPSGPRVIARMLSDRARGRARLRLATAMRVLLEQQAQANARLSGLRLEEAEAIGCFKHLPTVHELVASADALAKAQRKLPRAA